MIFYRGTAKKVDQCGRFGDIDHSIPWQTDHRFYWQRDAADALAA